MPSGCRVVAGLSCAALPASAADRFFLYNMTTSTIFTGVYLAPAGSDRWGGNQALNDKDKELDPSERLAIKDIARGRFDAKLVDPKGRTCISARHRPQPGHDVRYPRQPT